MVILTDPKTWPLSDILTLTRPDANSLWPECGLLTAKSPLTVCLTDAFTPGLAGRLLRCERIYYRSEEEISAAGWRAD